MPKLPRKALFTSTTFYCFTPMVTLATFLIEFVLAGYVIYKYKLDNFSRIVVVTLLLLGSFQLSEFIMCSGGDMQLWSRIGTACITMLPVLTLHLITLLTDRSKLIYAGYASGLGIIASMFIFNIQMNPECTGNFVILGFGNLFGWVFYFYYSVFVLAGLFLLSKSLLNQKSDKTIISWAFIAYLSLLVPTGLVYLFIAATRQGVPSIMCGFAITAALIVVFKLLPLLHPIRTAKKKNRS